MGARVDETGPLTAAILATLLRLVSAIPGAWTRELDGAFAGVSGMAVAMMNGVTVLSPKTAPASVAELLREVASSGLPHNLQLRPSASAEVVALAESSGMSLSHETPLMALTRLDGIERVLAASALKLRRIEPSEAELHGRIAGEVFNLPYEVMARVAGSAVLAVPEISCYVGERDGVPVATSLAMLIDRHLAIFNVATLAAQRQRGYGAAVTAIAVRDGFAAGARTAWLQSSPAGLGVYARLGFETIESWRCWIGTPSQT